MKQKTVTGIDLETYLQILSASKETCILHIKKDDRVGILSLHDGEPHDAQSKQQGEDAKHFLKYREEAVYEMLSWPEPTIEVHPPHQPLKRKITKSLAFLLLEYCRRSDEEKEETAFLSARKERQRPLENGSEKRASLVALKKQQEKDPDSRNDSFTEKDTQNRDIDSQQWKTGQSLHNNDGPSLAIQAVKTVRPTATKPAKQKREITTIASVTIVSAFIACIVLWNVRVKRSHTTPAIIAATPAVSQKKTPPLSPRSIESPSPLPPSAPAKETIRAKPEKKSNQPVTTKKMITKTAEKKTGKRATTIVSEKNPYKQDSIKSTVLAKQPDKKTKKNTAADTTTATLPERRAVTPPLAKRKSTQKPAEQAATRQVAAKQAEKKETVPEHINAPPALTVPPLHKEIAAGTNWGKDREQTAEKRPPATVTNAAINSDHRQKRTTPAAERPSASRIKESSDPDQVSRAIEDVFQAINQYKKYPRAARRAGYGGLVKVQITIKANGKVVSSRLHTTSGRKILDHAAMKATEKILDTKVTSAVLTEDLVLTIPVRFSSK
ncbi:MAG: hypothetical protein CSA26_06580 [Desulfobacterales bacterium]|nr:MAG: hypothetical protein CSA26_06580 [Desulfobacterales bacterium]